MPKTTKPTGFEPLMPESVTNRPNARSFMPYLPWVLIVLVLLLGGIFLYQQNQKAQTLQQELAELKQNPQKATEEETKALLEKVGQLIELPAEQPTIATVSDLAPLRDQPFFARAQVGDKVLIYSQAQKAVLYRPSTNKVIEVAPVDLDGGAAPANSNGNRNTNSNSSNSNRNTNNSSAGDESE